LSAEIEECHPSWLEFSVSWLAGIYWSLSWLAGVFSWLAGNLRGRSSVKV